MYDGLSDKLKNTKAMGTVKFDDQANTACRQINQEVVARGEDNPNEGGVVDRYNQIIGGDKATKAAE